MDYTYVYGSRKNGLVAIKKIINLIRMSTPNEIRFSIKRILDQLELCGVAISCDVKAIRLISRFIPEFYLRDEIVFVTKTTRRNAKNLVVVHPDYKFVRRGEYKFQVLPKNDNSIRISTLESSVGRYKKNCLFCNTEFFTNTRNKRFCSTHCSSKYLKIGKRDVHKEYGSTYPSLKGTYTSYRSSAKSRGYTFELSFENFSKLVKKDCFYCGKKPKKYNGIDRKINRIGYTKKNSVPCCWICNRMKWNMSTYEFASSIINLNVWAQKYCEKRMKKESKRSIYHNREL